jgi:hypothetical protein
MFWNEKEKLYFLEMIYSTSFREDASHLLLSYTDSCHVLQHYSCSIQISIEQNHFIKITAFSDVAPRSLIRVDRQFRDAYCLHRQGDE